MLMPKRTKYRRMQKGRVKGLAQRGAKVNFGDFGIKALEPGWITSRQIEAARIAMTRQMKRVGKVWIRIFPDKPITKKPAETRMGKGKGSPEYFVAVVKPGRILFELGGVDEELGHEAMRLAIQKLPIKCKIVTRPDYHSYKPDPSVVSGEDTSIKAQVATQDLTKIYGLGSTLAAELEEAGIKSYRDLAGLSLERLREIIGSDGSDDSGNEDTWAQQAQLLADGEYDQLNAYVEELREADGNVIVTEEEEEPEESVEASAEGDADASESDDDGEDEENV